MSKDNKASAAATATDVDCLIEEVRASLPGVREQPRRLHIDEIMRRIDEEIALRRPQATTDQATAGAPVLAGNVDCADPAAGAWTSTLDVDVNKRQFVLAELLVPGDEAFVEAAYRAVLRRAPEPSGREFYLAQLRNGRMSKVELLGAMRWSREGRARSVHVDGLLLPYTLHKWKRKKFIGPVVAWLHGVFRLGSFSWQQQRMDATVSREMHGLGETMNALAMRLQARLDEVDGQASRLQQISTRLEQDLVRARTESDDRLSAVHAEFAAQVAAVQSRLGAMDGVVASVAEARTAIRNLSRRNDEMVHGLSDQLVAMRTRLDAMDGVVADVVQARADIEQLSSRHDDTMSGLTERLTWMQSHLDTLIPFPASLLALQKVVGELESGYATVAGTSKSVESLASDLGELRNQVGAGLERLSGHEQELMSHRQSLHGHGAVLSLMEQAKVEEAENARSLDGLYAAFEDRFRGDMALVKMRAEPYIDFVLEAGAGKASAPVLDLGCGRGEWLELLRDRGLVGRGIDNNRIFVETCRGRGLEVLEGDVIEVMQALPAETFGAVTGFHIAEHLPFEVLVRLIDEARRLLMPGGMLALETPNPENLRVATQLFYMDPTHRNPLPPDALRWLVEARGFPRARIERWTLAREMEAPPLLEESIPGADSVNALLSQLSLAPDYAIVARRDPSA